MNIFQITYHGNMDTPEIQELIYKQLSFDTTISYPEEKVEAVKTWLSQVLAENIVKVRKSDNKGVSLFPSLTELPDTDTNSLIAALKGFYVKDTAGHRINLTYTIEPKVNVLDVCINKRFRAWAIANIDSPTIPPKRTKEEMKYHEYAHEHPNSAKQLIMKELGCKLYDEVSRVEQIINGTILEKDFDIACVALPNLKDIIKVLLDVDSEEAIDIKEQHKSVRIAKSLAFGVKLK